MARSSSPGHPRYDRTFVISNLAISRVRELCPDTNHRPDWDIGNALDRSLCHAIAEGQIEELWEHNGDGQFAKIEVAHLTENLPLNVGESLDYYASIKDADQPGPLDRALSKLWTPDERDKNFRRGEWRFDRPKAVEEPAMQEQKFQPKPDPPPLPTPEHEKTSAAPGGALHFVDWIERHQNGMQFAAGVKIGALRKLAKTYTDSLATAQVARKAIAKLSREEIAAIKQIGLDELT